MKRPNVFHRNFLERFTRYAEGRFHFTSSHIFSGIGVEHGSGVCVVKKTYCHDFSGREIISRSTSETVNGFENLSLY